MATKVTSLVMSGPPAVQAIPEMGKAKSRWERIVTLAPVAEFVCSPVRPKLRPDCRCRSGGRDGR